MPPGPPCSERYLLGYPVKEKIVNQTKLLDLNECWSLKILFYIIWKSATYMEVVPSGLTGEDSVILNV